MCQQDDSRLAVVESMEEMQQMVNWAYPENEASMHRIDSNISLEL